MESNRLKIKAKIIVNEELPLHKSRDDWRATYKFKVKNGKTVILVKADDANAFRAIMNELGRYFVAAEKINKLISSLCKS